MKRSRTPFPLFYNPTKEQKAEKLKAHNILHKHIKDKLYEFADELATVSKWLRLTDKSNDPRLQKETAWEKYHRTGSDKLEPELLRRLKNIIDNKKLGVQDEIDKALYHRIRDLRAVKGWYQAEAKNSKPKTTISYAYETDLSWLVFGSDEGLDVQDDPSLNAFMIGFHSINQLQGVNFTESNKLINPHAEFKQWCIDNDIPIPQRSLEMIDTLLEELRKEVRSIMSSLTQKQKTALILVLIEKNSYEKAGKKLGVSKKTVYERLWGKNNIGGAIKIIKKSDKLKEIAKKLRYNPHKTA